ncbi:MAG: molybdopterin-binding protein [Sedimentibacter sp.]
MIYNAVIIPTGDEIKSGIVLDTDSSMIMQQLIKLNCDCNVLRVAPVKDEENKIADAVKYYAEKHVDLIVLIGGSGGGHRYSKTLSKDFTHSSLELILDEKHSSEIYGKNGHMWSKLYCGKIGSTMVINVPGPYDEAHAAIKAFCSAYEKNKDNLKEINFYMMKSVKEQYEL